MHKKLRKHCQNTSHIVQAPEASVHSQHHFFYKNFISVITKDSECSCDAISKSDFLMLLKLLVMIKGFTSFTKNFAKSKKLVI